MEEAAKFLGYPNNLLVITRYDCTDFWAADFKSFLAVENYFNKKNIYLINITIFTKINMKISIVFPPLTLFFKLLKWASSFYYSCSLKQKWDHF